MLLHDTLMNRKLDVVSVLCGVACLATWDRKWEHDGFVGQRRTCSYTPKGHDASKVIGSVKHEHGRRMAIDTPGLNNMWVFLLNAKNTVTFKLGYWFCPTFHIDKIRILDDCFRYLSKIINRI